MKHIYIKVKYQDYLSYYEKYGHNRIDKWYRLQAFDANKTKDICGIVGLVYEEEIFEGIPTDYDIIKNELGYLISFKSKSDIRYRFDLSREPNTNIYHLSFSDFDNTMTDSSYENLTNRKESIDVFSRLAWILKDVNKKIEVEEYCIGGSYDDRKNVIYEYMMRFVDNWEKRDTIQYKSGWGLYFKIK